MTPKKHKSVSPSKKLSPAWKNPRSVLRRHVKDRKQIRKIVFDLNHENQRQFDSSHSQPLPQTSSKRRNPFKSSPKKRLIKKCKSAANFSAENWPSPPLFDENSSNALFQALDKHETVDGASLPTDFSLLASQESVNSVDFVLKNLEKTRLSAESCQSPISQTGQVPPLDLRLASRIRIRSSELFPWLKDENLNSWDRSNLLTLKAKEKSAAMRLFLEKKDEILSDQSDAGEFKSRLFSFGHFWCFPYLSWISNFPRISGEEKVAKNRQQVPSLATLDQRIVDALRSDWQDAFEHLIRALRCGECRIFYLCASQFTILFLNTRSNPPALSDSASTLADWASDIKAVITPTTAGLRQAFRKEGIELEMPFRSGSRRQSKSRESFEGVTESQPPFLFQDLTQAAGDASPNKSDEDGEMNLSGEDHSGWLEQVGVSPSISSQLRKTISESRLSTGSSSSTGGGEETALVTGAGQVQALFNCLLSSKLGQTLTGPSAGLPPTLLSPSPFEKAHISHLQMRCFLAEDEKGGRHVLEVGGGPVLPHTVHGISQLLSVHMDRFQMFLGDKGAYPGLNHNMAECFVSEKRGSPSFDDWFSSQSFQDVSSLTWADKTFAWS